MSPSDLKRLKEGEASQEEWRPIDGWAGYDVSSEGRVRGPLTPDGLRHRIDRNGYAYVSLRCRPRKMQKTGHLHLLVARAFLGAPPPDKEVDHIDGNKQNNRLCNLRYLTHTENVRAVRRKSRPRPFSRLRPPERMRMAADDRPVRQVARDYGVDPGTVRRARAFLSSLEDQGSVDE